MSAATTIRSECDIAQALPLGALAAIAVKRGCGHYAHFAIQQPTDSEISNETLACALMAAPMPEGFDCFRCGAMLLSDVTNDPRLVAEAAERLGAAARVGYVAALALEHDKEHRDFWAQIATLCPTVSTESLPGISRLTAEPGIGRLGEKLPRIWLRPRRE